MNQQRPSIVRYLVLATLCAAAAISYISRNCLSVAEQTVRHELGLSVNQMGWVMTAFFITYALLQIPSGQFADWRGNRLALPLFAIIWSLATAAAAFAGSFWSLMLWRLVAGAGQAGLFPGSVIAISRWIAVSRRALACGALASSMSVGGAIAAALTGILLDGISLPSLALNPLSWRFIFVLFAIPGLLWAIGFLVWYRDDPGKHRSVNRAELELIRNRPYPRPTTEKTRGESRDSAVPWRAILTSRDLWLICGQQCFRAAGYIFYATWFPTYLKENHNVSTAASGLLSSLPLLAVVVGSLAGGTLVDWVFNRTGSLRLSRQGIGIFALLTCAALIAGAFFIQDPLAAVLLISAGSFSAALAGPCAYAITMDKGGDHVATVFGAMNMAGNIAAAICPVIVAQLVTWTGNWDFVLFFFAGIYVFGAACWMGVDPDGSITRNAEPLN